MEVELRVLAGQDWGQISSLTGLPVDLLRHYEEIYFDIRDRLPSREYIHSMVIGDTDTPLTAVRKLAYEIGAPIIDVLLSIAPKFVTQEIFAERDLTTRLENQPMLSRLVADRDQQIGAYSREIVGAESAKTNELALATQQRKFTTVGVKNSREKDLPDLLQLATRLAG